MTEIKILLIEDELAHAKLVEVYLSAAANFRANLTHVTTLKECLNKLSNTQFDVLLLDLGLPDSNGLNTLYKVTEKYKEKPIIILTNDKDENLGVEAVKMGAFDFMNKEKLGIDSLSKAILYGNERKLLLMQISKLTQKLQDAELRIKILEGKKGSN